MKKIILVALLAALVLAVGCNTNEEPPAQNLPGPSSVSDHVSNPAEENPSLRPTVQERLQGLTQNQYEGIQITARVPEGTAITPGATVPVTVTIENTGDKTIVYEHGSSSYSTPDSLMSESAELQPILPMDYMGVATLDMVSQELKPGERLQYVTNFRAIAPHEKFESYTHEIYNAGEQHYIGDLEWPALSERYSDLVALSEGSYQGRVYFRYYVLEEGVTPDANAAPTGYAQAEFTVDVTSGETNGGTTETTSEASTPAQ